LQGPCRENHLMTRRICGFLAAILFVLISAGCVRREGRNSDCKWPAETSNSLADARHLSADAEFAEDLAIRYADTHHGGQAYDSARDRCMQSLFEQIAKAHDVSIGQVSNSLGRNRAYIDLAINLPFVLAYFVVAVAVARMIWRKYLPSEHGWIPGVVVGLFISLAIAGLGTMLGEVWSWLLESYRIGNDHMSYRVQRLWWVRQRAELFGGAVVVFWSALWATARWCRPSSGKREPPVSICAC